MGLPVCLTERSDSHPIRQFAVGLAALGPPYAVVPLVVVCRTKSTYNQKREGMGYSEYEHLVGKAQTAACR